MIEEIARTGVQVLFLTVVFYEFYTTMAGSISTQFIRNVLIYLAVYFLCVVLGLNELALVMKTLLVPAAVFLIILYQPELRRSFSPGFTRKKKLFRVGGGHASADTVDNVIAACKILADAKRGALIVFPRSVSVKNIINTGTQINADISTSMITTVFSHDTALHDGAMIIQGSKIVAAGCYLPLSTKNDIRKSFGTRHRAALGLSEETDAIILIVSEETSAISLAYNGNILYNLDTEQIKQHLLSLFNNLEITIDEMED